MFNNPEAAEREYRQGNELLLQAGIRQESINLFFSEPKMLPEPRFVRDWQSALRSIDVESSTATASQQSPAVSFSFKQWTPQFPHSMDPNALSVTALGSPEEDYALFSFSLTGLEKVSRWYRGRLKTSVSAPQDLQVLERSFDSPVDWLELEDLVHDFRFRPKLIDGVPQAVNATLTYQLAQ